MRNKNTVLLLLPLMLLGSQVRAQADSGIGVVLLTAGDVTAVAKEGKQRPLSRKSPLYVGDTVNVPEDARAQIRFSDASLITLDGSTDFRVDTYKHDGGSDDQFVATLIKGSFRTLTGAIAKGGKGSYSVSTPVAVMGVRGSGLECSFIDDKLAVGVWEGQGWVEGNNVTLNLGDTERYNYALVQEDQAPDGSLDKPEALEQIDDTEGVIIPAETGEESSQEGESESLSESNEKISELSESEVDQMESDVTAVETFPDDADEIIFEDPQSEFDQDDVFEEEFPEDETPS